MNLSDYEILALIHVPYSLIMWTLDFLSDKEITHSEVKIGALQYVHHLFGVFNMGVIFLLLFSKSIKLSILTFIVIIVSQIGFLINNDSCWLLTLTNKAINPDRPNRKWRAEIGSLIKHYIRGDSWGYSDINVNINYSSVKFINTVMIIHLIKLIILNANTRRVP